MRIANYHVHGEIGDPGLIHFLSEEIGLYGSSDAARIVLHINSPGGDLLTAIQAINLIRSSPVPVLTILNGAAESAALLILMAGNKRAAFSNSFGMAHHLSTAIEGKFHDLQSNVEHLNMLDSTMIALWKTYTKLDMKTIRNEMLGRHDKYLDTAALKRYNIIDEILTPGSSLQRFMERPINDKEKTKKRVRREGDSESEDS